MNIKEDIYGGNAFREFFKVIVEEVENTPFDSVAYEGEQARQAYWKYGDNETAAEQAVKDAQWREQWRIKGEEVLAHSKRSTT